jgi:hypothetical protein
MFFLPLPCFISNDFDAGKASSRRLNPRGKAV